jgi:hypothetical protein
MHLYTTVAAMRAEGVAQTISDDRILDRIRYASRSIESWTGRQFYPIRKSVHVDGRGSSELRIGDPIIRVESVELLTEGYDYGPEGILLEDIEVYNRHLQGVVTDPDDRDNPRIIFVAADSDWIWPAGSRNVLVGGVFGYTDPTHGDRVSIAGPFELAGGMTLEVAVDGEEEAQEIVIETGDYEDVEEATADEVAAALSRDLVGAYAQAEGSKVRIFSQRLGIASAISVVGGTAATVLGFPAGVGRYLDGITPPDIVRCCQLMVVRDLDGIARQGEREDRQRSRFVTSMRTRENSVSYGFPADVGERRGHTFIGYFTGDPEIDNILARYCAPPEGYWV